MIIEVTTTKVNSLQTATVIDSRTIAHRPTQTLVQIMPTTIIMAPYLVMKIQVEETIDFR